MYQSAEQMLLVLSAMFKSRCIVSARSLTPEEINKSRDNGSYFTTPDGESFCLVQNVREAIGSKPPIMKALAHTTPWLAAKTMFYDNLVNNLSDLDKNWELAFKAALHVYEANKVKESLDSQ